MKILLVNNRLKVYGGEGTYMTSIGEELTKMGHDVQYFGLQDENNLHGNRFGIYAKKSKNPLSIKRNKTNKKRFGKLLDLFKPDIIHVNLIYFTLTPSILIEAKKRNIPIIQTVHDGKIVCPSYQLFIKQTNKACLNCLNHDFSQCYKNKCVKCSSLLSYLAFKESRFNYEKKYYDLIDLFIFPSFFMKDIHTRFGINENKTVVLKNFSRIQKRDDVSKNKKPYVLFFGRVTNVKGTKVLAEVIKKFPDISFIVAGEGEDVDLFKNFSNCECVGFQTNDNLTKLIEEASVTVFPSIWFENCPMGIAESIALGTPVIGSNIGGIPEMIIDGKTGLLFEPGNAEQLIEKLNYLYNYKDVLNEMSKECVKTSQSFNVLDYCKILLNEYQKLVNEVKRV